MGEGIKKTKGYVWKIGVDLDKAREDFWSKRSLTQDSNEKSDAWEALKTCCELTVDHCKSEFC